MKVQIGINLTEYNKIEREQLLWEKIIIRTPRKTSIKEPHTLREFTDAIVSFHWHLLPLFMDFEIQK